MRTAGNRRGGVLYCPLPVDFVLTGGVQRIHGTAAQRLILHYVKQCQGRTEVIRHSRGIWLKCGASLREVGGKYDLSNIRLGCHQSSRTLRFTGRCFARNFIGRGEQAPRDGCRRLCSYSRTFILRRLIALLNSRSHNTELATATHRIQSPKLRLTVENACCRTET